MGKLSIEVTERKSEDLKDVKYIIKGFMTDKYTPERLNLALSQAINYEKSKRGGSRGNRNVITAINQMITNPILDNSTLLIN